MARTPRTSTAPQGMVRLQKLMADCGVAARRVCEAIIEEGRVEVNGETVSRLPVFVDPFKDQVVVDGRELPRARKSSAPEKGRSEGAEMTRRVYLMLHKPERVLTAASDPTGRVTVNELVKYPVPVRLFPVGRLEWMASGLVLLTNDGALANRLSHPSYGVERVYEAAVKGAMNAGFVEDLERGINLKAKRLAGADGGKVSPIRLEAVQRKGPDEEGRGNARTVLRITVKPGNTVKLAELLGEAGVKVSKLVQVALGPLKMIDVPRPGDWRELERHEVTALKRAGKGKDAGSAPARTQASSRTAERPVAGPQRPAAGAMVRRGAPSRWAGDGGSGPSGTGRTRDRRGGRG